MNSVLTVSQLNFFVKSLLDGEPRLQSVYLRGEISNLTDHYRSGHLYLTLKDEKCAVKAVMFAGSASRLRFRPKDGMTVLVRGKASLYDVTGSYQFYIEDMQPDGTGAMNLAYEQLKKKLSEEGLFDPKWKKPLPDFPGRIGVITSPTGAAIQDILRILKRRYSMAEIILCPVQVQGASASVQLADAVRRFNRLAAADVLIIGRGGGSAEDLWEFNDEALARAVFASEIPVVSAVGHETDFTICDFVADVRASTPSAAAELVSPDGEALKSYLARLQRQMKHLVYKRLAEERRRLNTAAGARVLRAPGELVQLRRMRLDLLSSALRTHYASRVGTEKTRLLSLAGKLDVLSPLKVLARGYGVVRKEEHIIHSVQQLAPEDEIELMLTDGSLRCTVEEIRRNEDEEKAEL